MALMSKAQFKREIRISIFHRKRSPMVKDLYTLFEEYHKTNSENRKMKCMVYIYMMCKQYLHTKPEGKRRRGVTRILNNVKEELNSQRVRSLLASKAAGTHYSSGVKRDIGSTGRGGGSKELDQAYQIEAILPQRNFVQKMHLNMESILGDDKYFSVSLISQKLETDEQQRGAGLQESEEAAHKFLSGSPLSDIFDTLHAMWIGTEQGKFNYLSSEQRLRYLVTLRNGFLAWYATDQIVQSATSFGQLRPILYAMDTDERLFLVQESGIGTQWNHSSALSGHPVICAGTMVVNAGKLVTINNDSGHYKPDASNLADCVQALVDWGIDENSFNVQVMPADQTYKAAQFLASTRQGGRGLIG